MALDNWGIEEPPVASWSWNGTVAGGETVVTPCQVSGAVPGDIVAVSLDASPPVPLTLSAYVDDATGHVMVVIANNTPDVYTGSLSGTVRLSKLAFNP